jgi:hypothetical protein
MQTGTINIQQNAINSAGVLFEAGGASIDSINFYVPSGKAVAITAFGVAINETLDAYLLDLVDAPLQDDETCGCVIVKAMKQKIVDEAKICSFCVGKNKPFDFIFFNGWYRLRLTGGLLSLPTLRVKMKLVSYDMADRAKLNCPTC